MRGDGFGGWGGAGTDKTTAILAERGGLPSSWWSAHSSVLAWRILGTGEPGGLPSMGSHRLGQD